MSVLETIIASTREDVARRRAATPVNQLERGLPVGPRGRFAEALRGEGIALIAEYKRRSPSAGPLRAGSTVAEMVAAYERGGAAALSVLTEERHFDGSLEDLAEARRASALPVLRKDFIVDPYQLLEAAHAGADAILLIVAGLDPASLSALTVQAQDLGLDVLVEVHDRAELGCALECGADVLGINNRDLADFSVDVGRTLALLADVPEGRPVISESGLRDRAQLEGLQRAGVAGVLVGEALMRADDPELACRDLTGSPVQ